MFEKEVVVNGDGYLVAVSRDYHFRLIPTILEKHSDSNNYIKTK